MSRVEATGLEVGEIVEALDTLQDKYFNVGLHLGIEVHKLRKIECEHSNISRRMIETIDLWLQRELDCSWSKLACAVEKTGDPVLAQSLRLRDCPINEPTSVLPHKFTIASVLNETVTDSPTRNSSDQESGIASLASSASNSDSEGDDSSQKHKAFDIKSFNLSPGCGCGSNCGLYTLCTKGCPRPDYSKRLPILTKLQPAHPSRETCLAVNDFDGDFDYYEESTADINEKFGDLVDEVCHSFVLRAIEKERVILYLKAGFPMLKCRLEDMNKATCLEQVFGVVVEQACSWFDYHVIEALIKKFGTSDDEKKLKEYEKHLAAYTQQRLPKAKHIHIGDGGQRGCKQLVIKIEKQWDMLKFIDLQALCKTFASILSIDRKDLYLADVREGCILMTFMVPESIAELFSTSMISMVSSGTVPTAIEQMKLEDAVMISCGKFKWRATKPTSSKMSKTSIKPVDFAKGKKVTVKDKLHVSADPGPWMQSLFTLLTTGIILTTMLLIAVAGVWVVSSTAESNHHVMNNREICKTARRTDWERNNSHYLQQRESPGMDPSTGYNIISSVFIITLTVFSILFTWCRSTYCRSTQSSSCLPLSQSLSSHWITQPLSYQNRHLQKILETNLLKFVTKTNWKLLSPFLISQHLLDPDEHCSIPEDEMVSHFYTQILPLHKRKDYAYLRLYNCLQEEDKHHGHKELATIFSASV